MEPRTHTRRDLTAHAGVTTTPGNATITRLTGGCETKVSDVALECFFWGGQLCGPRHLHGHRPAGSGQLTQLPPGSTDGSQIASGILWGERTIAVGKNLYVAVVVHDAEAGAAELTYPADITAN